MALGIVLLYFEFPLLPAATHLKLDFSFIPILVVALLYGNKEALFVAFIINVVHFFLKGDLSGLPIGVGANFIALSVYLLVFVYFQKKEKLLHGCLLATLAVSTIMLLANYFWITRWYFKILGIPLADDFLLYCIMTVGLFNLIRWSIISIVNYSLNNWLSRFIRQIK